MRPRRLVAAGLVLVALAAIVALLARPLMRAAGRFLVQNEAPQHADAIVVLAGGYPDRILEAVALYREGWAPRILLGREPANAGFRKLEGLGLQVPKLVDINVTIAEQMGVPADAIAVVAQPAGSTFDEAQVIIDTVLQQGYRTILLVTSKYHSHRAARIYRFLAGDRLRIIVRAARDDDFQPDAWWHNRVSTRRVAFEYQKLVAFLLLDRWRPSRAAAPTAVPTPA
ncbi:MAG: YdcF family protein [bacterium]